MPTLALTLVLPQIIQSFWMDLGWHLVLSKWNMFVAAGRRHKNIAKGGRAQSGCDHGYGQTIIFVAWVGQSNILDQVRQF